MHYTITEVDNRGTNETPFGFVYLANGKQDAGRLGFGANRDDPNPLAVWPSRDTPDDISPLTIERARAALKQRFPKLAPTAEVMWRALTSGLAGA